MRKGRSFFSAPKLIHCNSLNQALQDGGEILIKCSDGYSLVLEGGLPHDKPRTVGIICPDGKKAERVRLAPISGYFQQFVVDFATGGIALFEEIDMPIPESRQSPSESANFHVRKPATCEIGWAEVLMVTPTASLEEIQRAYRKLAAEYHPDKVSHLGPKLRALAHTEIQRINEAYQHLSNARRAHEAESPE